MREYRLITFCCNECGVIVKTLINKDKITFEVIGKLYNERNVLTENGFYRCVECDKESNVRFEFIYN